MASREGSFRISSADCARAKRKFLRADSAVTPDAVATEESCTLSRLCNIGKITPRAKLPAPMQPTLRLSDRRILAAAVRVEGALLVVTSIPASALGYSRIPVYAPLLRILP